MEAPVGEDCVHLYSDGTWNDNDCAGRRPFVCGFEGGNSAQHGSTAGLLPTTVSPPLLLSGSAVASTCTVFTTPDTYNHNPNFLTYPLDESRSVVFSVRAHNDAHIGVSFQKHGRTLYAYRPYMYIPVGTCICGDSFLEHLKIILLEMSCVINDPHHMIECQKKLYSTMQNGWSLCAFASVCVRLQTFVLKLTAVPRRA